MYPGSKRFRVATGAWRIGLPVTTGGMETAVPEPRCAFRALLALVISVALSAPAGAQQAGDEVPSTDGRSEIRQQGAAALTPVDPGRDAEVSFFLGGLIGGDLASILDDGFSLTGTLQNGRTYGGRVGYYPFPLGVEGSFTYSNSGLGLEAELDRARVEIAARVMYFEANAILLLLPGPVQPFLTGGGGIHSYEFVDLAGVQLRKWGLNFGGGLKANIKRVSLRVDVRDHVTQVSTADLNIDDELAELIGVQSQSLHNAELSFGIGVRF